jgi:hypothetical protein
MKESLNAEEVIEKPQTPADDEELIPYHTKQASFALLYLLFFSVLMFTLPFGAFFGTRHALQEYFGVYGFPNTCWSVLASVEKRRLCDYTLNPRRMNNCMFKLINKLFIDSSSYFAFLSFSCSASLCPLEYKHDEKDRS